MSRGAARRLLAIALSCTGALTLIPARALASPTPRLSVTGAILIEQSTGQELYGVNPDRELAIASATKLMTALLTLEHVHRLGTTFAQTDYYPAATDSQIGLVPGERMTVHDLLLALMLPSADDAAEDLAYNVGHGSTGRFVQMMNTRARELGLRHTHYSTPSGLDTPGNYSSAADLVKLAGHDLTHSAYFARIVARPSAVLYSGNYVRHIVNINDLVGRVAWISGVKTGHTATAGYVLVASGQKNGMTLISAVLGTSSAAARDANTMALLDYGFANFRLEKPVSQGELLARPTIRDQLGGHAALIAAGSVVRVLPRHSHVTVVVRAPRQLAGPLPRHAPIGTAVVLADGRPIARVPLLLARALPAVSALVVASRYITNPLMLLAIALAGGAVVTFVVRRRRRTRTAAGAWEAA